MTHSSPLRPRSRGRLADLASVAAALVLPVTALAAPVTPVAPVAASVSHPVESAGLPWSPNERVYLTQDCHDACFDDHVGSNGYAWDFAKKGAFDVVAPRAGTVVHVKMSSNHGSERREDADATNYLVLDHGDGTYSVMLHLAHGSLDPAVRCGSFVRRGQRLAVVGNTGWSSGAHLHYQVNRIPPGMDRTCECGPDGMACAPHETEWDLFWSYTPESATVPVRFEEWSAASVCTDRHERLLLQSRNVDRREEVIEIVAGGAQFRPLRGNWRLAGDGTHHEALVGESASAKVSFEGKVRRPGVYEVWLKLPAAGRGTRAEQVSAEVIGLGGTRTHVPHPQDVPGGGFQRLPGRFHLSGKAGEGVVLSTAGAAERALVMGNVVLRRVADAG
jgi:hypothetical protein